MLAVLSHQLRSLQDTHTLTKGQASSGQKKAGPVGRGATPLVCVCVCSTTSFAQAMLSEGTGEQALLDLFLANYVLIYQDSNNSHQLSGC